MAGFYETAEFFAAKAKKEKSEERRRNLVRAAEFYRMLAELTPTFPSGYKPPKLDELADRMGKRAEECRAIAGAIQDRECKAKLLRLAETYEQASRFRE